ncbi:uncharacterized protein LOC122510018 isoform X2 [Leptopilina heterotoma]|nr:uncharacterized protein LOC122510018 isoform X2 [Leptopilina heterotoma]
MPPLEKAKQAEKKIKDKRFSVTTEVKNHLKTVPDLKTDSEESEGKNGHIATSTFQNESRKFNISTEQDFKKNGDSADALTKNPQAVQLLNSDNTESDTGDKNMLSKKQKSSVKLKPFRKRSTKTNTSSVPKLKTNSEPLNGDSADALTKNPQAVQLLSSDDTESDSGDKNMLSKKQKSSVKLKPFRKRSTKTNTSSVSKLKTNSEPLNGVAEKSRATKSISEVIIRKLDSMAVDIKEIKKCQLKQMQNGFVKQIEKAIMFEEENRLKLPFKQKEEFEKFDNDLSVDSELHENFKNSLPKEFDAKLHLRGSIKNIIKKYLNKELIMQYTVSKKKEGRSLFCDTTMYKCMYGVLKETHVDITSGGKQQISEKYFASELGTVFSSSKDWEGGRISRQKKSVSKKNKRLAEIKVNGNDDEESFNGDDQQKINQESDTESDQESNNESNGEHVSDDS